FEDDKIIEEITAMTYPSIGDFLKTHVVGQTPIDYNKFFEKVGLETSQEKVETDYVRNAGAFIVAGNQEKGTIYFNDLVSDNSFWAENGVLPNDEIIEVNGTQLTMANANSVLGATFQWQEGDDLVIKLNRAGEEVVVKTKIAKAYTKGNKLKEDENASQKAVELRNAWIKG
ncbi:MAG: peptidase M61, partial [Aquimarina sp.]|nr:peptidase M61 [Aquimarina sp.]